MSLENVEVARRMFELWNAGDVDCWLQCWHGDAVWVSEPFAALDGTARTYRGHRELRRFPVDVLEGFADLGVSGTHELHVLLRHRPPSISRRSRAFHANRYSEDRKPALAGMTGAGLACTVSMISALSIPWR